MPSKKKQPDAQKLDKAVAESRRAREQLFFERTFRVVHLVDHLVLSREKALKMYPWVCGRCGREFTRENLHELTVHHRDHDHDNNPPDGSNWELLCLYCHDNEHARLVDATEADERPSETERATHKPFADLESLLKKGE